MGHTTEEEDWVQFRDAEALVMVTCSTTILRPLFQDYPGEPVPEENLRANQRPTSVISPFLHWMPFLLQLSHFILDWDRH